MPHGTEGAHLHHVRDAFVFNHRRWHQIDQHAAACVVSQRGPGTPLTLSVAARIMA
jgi:hypothetical protein